MEGKRTDIVFISFVFLMAFCMFIFYKSGMIFRYMSAGAVIVFYYYYSRRTDAGPDAEKKMLPVLLWISGAAAVLHMVFSPAIFTSGEWAEIGDAYYKLAGEKSFVEYSQRLGASTGLLSGAVIAGLLRALCGNAEALMIIPQAVFAVSLVYLFLAARIIMDEKFAVASVFVYTLSTWGLFNSSLLLSAMYLPLLVFMFIYHFYSYIKTVLKRHLAVLLMVFTSGFLMHATWIIFVPFAVLMLFEERKNFTKKEITAIAMWGGAAFVLSAAILIYYSAPFRWGISHTIISGENLAGEIISNLKSLLPFFVVPGENHSYITQKVPLFGFAEIVLLLGGITACLRSAGEKQCRLMLAGFIISLTAVMFSGWDGNTAKHIMILPFAVLMSGYFMRKIITWKYAAVIIVSAVVIFGASFIERGFVWKTKETRESAAKRAAEYIRKEYSGRDFMLVNEMLYDNSFEVSLRSCGFIRKCKPCRTVIVVSNEYNENYFKKAYGFGNVTGRSFPLDIEGSGRKIVIYTIDVSGDAEKYESAARMKTYTGKMGYYIWDGKYVDAIETGKKWFIRELFLSRADRLNNTFINNYQLQAAYRAGLYIMADEEFRKNEAYVYETPDWYYNMGIMSKSAGKSRSAREHLFKAIKLAPGWKAPGRALYSK